jgi:glycerol uptake facilitator protein
MVPERSRRLAAEAIGTFLLVLFGAGSVAAVLRLGDGEFTPGSTVAVALAFGIAVAVAVHAFGDVSGAHINPAVTVSLAAVGRFPWGEVLPYVLAQLAGGVLAAYGVIVAFPEGVDVGGVGATVLGDDVGYLSGIVAEAMATFLLMVAVMAMAVHERAAGWAGWIIGMAVTAAILVFLPITGASLNPARTFGPYLASWTFGGNVPWRELPVYVVGPLLGGVLAAVAYQLVARPPRD